MPKFLIILFCAALLVPDLRAQPEFVTTHSFSKQFIVYGPKVAPVPRGNRIPLDPALLAVSCDRIKQTLLAELGGPSRWQMNLRGNEEGKIYVVIHPGLRQPVVITPIRNPRKFSYRIDLPNAIEPAHLIEAVTQATLLELANRKSTETFSRVPRWLAQGLAAQVQAAAPDTLVLQRHLPVSITKVRVDPTAKIRQQLEHFEPLTFDELSWPDDLSQERSQHFDPCAQLLVHELSRLKNGDDCLRRFLEELPNHLNWQIGFLRAFQPHFQQLIDVEKWWGLRLVNLTGRDAAQRWSREQSLEKIETALRVPVQYFSTNTLPSRHQVSLQEIISQWEPHRQKPALQKAVTQLIALRPRVQPELVRLLDDYCRTIGTYLERFDDGLFRRVFSGEKFPESGRATQASLDALDQQRLALRKPKPSTREEAILSALKISEQGSGPSRRQ